MKTKSGFFRLWLFLSVPWALAALVVASVLGELPHLSPAAWLSLIGRPGAFALVFAMLAWLASVFSG